MSIQTPITIKKEDIKQTSIINHWLWTTGLRLDAGYYFDEAFQALEILSNYEGQILEDVVEKIYNLPRFKRIYASSDNFG